MAETDFNLYESDEPPAIDWRDLPYLLELNDAGAPLVTIKPDGTVVVHREGADREAARVFYEALQMEGKTLHARIAELERENRELRSRLYRPAP